MDVGFIINNFILEHFNQILFIHCLRICCRCLTGAGRRVQRLLLRLWRLLLLSFVIVNSPLPKVRGLLGKNIKSY